MHVAEMPSSTQGWVFSPVGFSAFRCRGFSSCTFELLPIARHQSYLCPWFYLSYLAGLCALSHKLAIFLALGGLVIQPVPIREALDRC